MSQIVANGVLQRTNKLDKEQSVSQGVKVVIFKGFAEGTYTVTPTAVKETASRGHRSPTAPPETTSAELTKSRSSAADDYVPGAILVSQPAGPSAVDNSSDEKRAIAEGEAPDKQLYVNKKRGKRDASSALRADKDTVSAVSHKKIHNRSLADYLKSNVEEDQDPRGIWVNTYKPPQSVYDGLTLTEARSELKKREIPVYQNSPCALYW
ncbi:hypothetical protein Daus18300_010021 [Diaporthe australafricana]|uniref:Uncharacterized protein n=1 Tax=Diaporthe australafricana TaxID=127596 RepID=A0ABR3WCA8_9PEZI